MNNNAEYIVSIINSFYPDSGNCIGLDTEDNIVFVGESRLADFGVNHSSQLVGKKLYSVFQIKQPDNLIFIQDISSIKTKILSSHQIVTAFVCADFNGNNTLHLAQIRSITQNNVIIGCIVNAKDFSLSVNNSAKSVKLTKYQEEIMFLLGLGFSQKEIADIYNITRGSIVRMIGFICDKFEINGASSERLIDLVYNYGYGIPPYHLLKTGVFIINSTFITKQMFISLFK